MKENVKYLFYILEHKRNVFLEGRKLGVPTLQLLRHDLSKFSRHEFKAYRQKFFGQTSCKSCLFFNSKTCNKGLSVAQGGKNCAGYSPTAALSQQTEQAFRLAWQHHQKNNAHHWQYWLSADGKVAARIPQKYVLEMIADWRAMSRKFSPGKDIRLSTIEWYKQHKTNMILHAESRQLIEKHLGL